MSDNSPELFDVVVIGGGLAGLAAAATAARAGRRTVLLEGHTPGGRASTDERRGFKFNQGAHAVYLGGAGNAVLGRLGVTHTGHPPSDLRYPRAPRRHGVAAAVQPRRGAEEQARDAPGQGPGGEAAGLGVCPASTRPRWRTVPPRHGSSDLGLRDDATAVVRTVMRVASFSDDLAGISADAVVRQLQLAVKPGVSYLDGGWQTLVDGLLGAALTAGVDVRAHHLAFAIEPDRHGWVVRTGGDEMRAVRGSQRDRRRPRAAGGRRTPARRAGVVRARPAHDGRVSRPRPASRTVGPRAVRCRPAVVLLDALPAGRPRAAWTRRGPPHALRHDDGRRRPRRTGRPGPSRWGA